MARSVANRACCNNMFFTIAAYDRPMRNPVRTIFAAFAALLFGWAPAAGEATPKGAGGHADAVGIEALAADLCLVLSGVDRDDATMRLSSNMDRLAQDFAVHDTELRSPLKMFWATHAASLRSVAAGDLHGAIVARLVADLDPLLQGGPSGPGADLLARYVVASCFARAGLRIGEPPPDAAARLAGWLAPPDRPLAAPFTSAEGRAATAAFVAHIAVSEPLGTALSLLSPVHAADPGDLAALARLAGRARHDFRLEPIPGAD